MLLRRFSFTLIIASFFVATHTRSLNLSQKELQSVGSAISSALKHHVKNEVGYKIFGAFTIESGADNPDDFDITLDLAASASETNDAILSGKFD